MLAKTKAIVLRNTNYSESSIISKMYTREFGIRSYILQSIKKSKKGIKPALVQPLSIVELDVYEKPNTGIQRIKDLRPSILLVNVHSDFVRQSIAMFYVEFLNHYMQSEFCEYEVFDYLETAIHRLENESNVANHPIELLLNLSNHFGLNLGTNFTEATPYFSINDGIYVGFEEAGVLNKELSQVLNALQLGVQNPIPVNKLARRQLLNGLILYYQTHLHQSYQMKSLDILSEVLD